MGFVNAWVTQWLIAVFSTRGAALALAGLILLGAVAILTAVYIGRVQPLRRSLMRRIADFPRTIASTDLAPADAVMMAPGREGWKLRRAWTAYRASLMAWPDGRFRSGAPAWSDFSLVSPETQVLGWWSNLFVAIGLILTFLGVVAALSEATGVLGDSSNPNAMQGALSGLLTITATKFWTSIAGVAASVLMRVFERRWTSRIDRLVEELCEAIDDRIPPVTPSLLASELLGEARAQTRLLSELAALAGESGPGELKAAE